MTHANEANKRSVSLELAALFVFALVLIGNLSVIRFAEKYYSHFDITLSEMNFVPRVYDYANIALVSLIGAGIAVLIIVLLMKMGIWMGAFTAEKTKPSKAIIKFAKKREQIIIMVGNFLEKLVKVIFWGLVAYTLYSSIDIFSGRLGEISAESKTNFSTISPESEDIQKLIIYKNDNEIILKTYSVSKKEFLKGYEVINGATYTARSIRI